MRSNARSVSLFAALGASFAVLTLLGCGNGGGADDDGTSDPDAPPAGIDAGIDAPVPPGFTRLIGRTWSLGAGQADTYRCVRVTVPQDLYITAFAAQAPLGTHHTVLTVRDGEPGSDGEYNCTAGSLEMNMLYASGVGTDIFELPPGVGLKVKAGQQVNLNLHLFNASENAISGESAVLVKAQTEPTAMLAEMIFAGTAAINVPAGATRTVNGGCTLPSGVDQQLFALWPHMHQYATHQKVELVHGGNTSTLLDRPYSFFEQGYYPQQPLIPVSGGDQLKVACTYTNTSGSTVTFGDSSNQEMCFTGMYFFPARGASIFSCSGLGF
jgi:hypothetical protein